jgi:NitT/TauT family transport system substrate-binding protein
MTRARITRRGALGVLAGATLPASAPAAQGLDRVSVGVLRFISSGPLFIAAERGYFREAGFDLNMRFFEAAQPIAVATVSGDVDFGLTAFTAGFFNLAGQGALKVIAAQAREKKGFEGNAFLASNAAFERGLRAIENVAGRSFALTQLGSSFHYQLGQLARIRNFDLRSVDMRPLQSLPNMVAAVQSGQADSMIIASHIAKPMVARGDAKHIAWYSDYDEYQFGALFTSTRATTGQRDRVQRFVRAYQRGTADYARAFLRVDGNRRVFDAFSDEMAALVAKHAFPNLAPAQGVEQTKAAAVFVDEHGRLDVADIHRQIEWLKGQNLVQATVDPRTVLDLSFVDGHFNIPR